MIFFTKKNMSETPDIRFREQYEQLGPYEKDFTEKNFKIIIESMEKARLAEYATYLAHPYRLLFMNFLIGLSRGLGSTIGLAVVIMIVGFIVKNIILTYFPFVGHYIADIKAMADIYRH